MSGSPEAFGPFAFQANNSTREFEYAWAYHATELAPRMRVIDLGGSLSGLQFVLSLEGWTSQILIQVANLLASGGTALSPANHARLNEALSTNVSLHMTPIQDVGLPNDSIDRVYCISTLEHVPPEIMAEIRRVLKPGGRLILAIDLFLDLQPFAAAETNEWGTNIDIRSLTEFGGFNLISGDPRELTGSLNSRPREWQLRSISWSSVGHTRS